MPCLQAVFLAVRSLNAAISWWLPGLVVLWSIATALQEPVFFRRLGIGFFWESTGVALELALAMLPLLWRCADGRVAALTFATTGRPLRYLAVTACSIMLYGCALASLAALAAVAAGRIVGAPHDWPVAASTVGSALAVLLVLAPFTGLLLRASGSLTVISSAWLLVGLAALIFVHWGLRLGSGKPLAVADIVPVLQAAAGSLLLAGAVSFPRRSR